MKAYLANKWFTNIIFGMSDFTVRHLQLKDIGSHIVNNGLSKLCILLLLELVEVSSFQFCEYFY